MGSAGKAHLAGKHPNTTNTSFLPVLPSAGASIACPMPTSYRTHRSAGHAKFLKNPWVFKDFLTEGKQKIAPKCMENRPKIDQKSIEIRKGDVLCDPRSEMRATLDLKRASGPVLSPPWSPLGPSWHLKIEPKSRQGRS